MNTFSTQSHKHRPSQPAVSNNLGLLKSPPITKFLRWGAVVATALKALSSQGIVATDAVTCTVTELTYYLPGRSAFISPQLGQKFEGNLVLIYKGDASESTNRPDYVIDAGTATKVTIQPKTPMSLYVSAQPYGHNELLGERTEARYLDVIFPMSTSPVINSNGQRYATMTFQMPPQLYNWLEYRIIPGPSGLEVTEPPTLPLIEPPNLELTKNPQAKHYIKTDENQVWLSLITVSASNYYSNRVSTVQVRVDDIIRNVDSLDKVYLWVRPGDPDHEGYENGSRFMPAPKFDNTGWNWQAYLHKPRPVSNLRVVVE